MFGMPLKLVYQKILEFTASIKTTFKLCTQQRIKGAFEVTYLCRCDISLDILLVPS